MFSKYYTGYQPKQRQQTDYTDIQQILAAQKQQQQAQQQQGNNPQSMQNFGSSMKSMFGGSDIPASGGQSFGGGNSAYGGIDIPTSTPQSLDMPASTEPSWYSNLFSSGGAPTNVNMAAPSSGGGSAIAYAPPVAALLAANVAHNKGISPWHETAKGHLGGNTLDYFRNGDHGFMSKITGGSLGDFGKSATDFASLDFGNSLQNAGSGLKNLFKLKLF
jgi:hypothetical protein